MRIGSSITLIAVGLVLALAVNVDLDGLDLQQIGWILAAVGVVGLIISVVLTRRARPVVTREVGPAVVREDPYAAPPADPQYRNPEGRY